MGLDESMDQQMLLRLCEPAIERASLCGPPCPSDNSNRVVGTMLGSEVTRRYGPGWIAGRHDPICISKARPGRVSAPSCRGASPLSLEGDANDYVGKGLSGGKIIVHPPRGVHLCARGKHHHWQRRFLRRHQRRGLHSAAWRANGFACATADVNAVVEGVGDHGCEYMTGGRVVVLGRHGPEFCRRHVRRHCLCAGLKRGFRYLRCNRQMVTLQRLDWKTRKSEEVRRMIQRHAEYTGSQRPASPRLMEGLSCRSLSRSAQGLCTGAASHETDHEAGLSGEEAVMAAFEENITRCRACWRG